MYSENKGRINAVMLCSPKDAMCTRFIERCNEDEIAAAKVNWHRIPPKEAGPETLKDVQIVVTVRFPAVILQYAEKLEWIQFLGAGIEHSLFPELLAKDIILTNASGVHESPISEHVLGMMLMFARGLHRCVRMQTKHEWNPAPFFNQVTELSGATVGIIGLGAIGGGIARRAKALGMTVIATKRHPETTAPNVDILLPFDNLDTLLKSSDYLVLSAPLTAETRGMIGEAQLRKMKPNAVLINIARGELIQQDALILALNEGWIGGAGLDVTVPEPLPDDSPLWDMPNTIISPHVAGLNPKYGDRAAEIFLHNLKALLENRPAGLINLVDKELGY